MEENTPQEPPQDVLQDDAVAPCSEECQNRIDVDKLTLREFMSNYFLRLVALFMQFSFASVAGGAIIGVVWWKAMGMAGFMGLATVGKFVFKNMAKTGRISRRDLDVALALASEDLDNNFAVTQQMTYYEYSKDRQ